MFQGSKRSCRTIILLVKPFVLRLSHWRRRRGLLKLLGMAAATVLQTLTGGTIKYFTEYLLSNMADSLIRRVTMIENALFALLILDIFLFSRFLSPC